MGEKNPKKRQGSKPDRSASKGPSLFFGGGKNPHGFLSFIGFQ